MTTIPAIFSDLPTLAGSISFDNIELARVSTDFGQIVHTRPLAVVKPHTVQDIISMVKYAAARGLKIMSRGMSHSAFGQCQCDGGIVFDMTSFNAILAAELSGATPWMEAQAGATWDKLVKFSGAAGFAPPTTTDWQMLTMGGTLSTGGVGFMSYQYGLQTDNVLELDVVDGQGELHTCSAQQNADLFNSVRAGLGQYGIISRARLKLAAMPQKMHVYQMFFTSLASFTQAMQELTAAAYFECLHAFVIPNNKAAILTRLNTCKSEHDGADIQQYCAQLNEQISASQAKWLFFVEVVKYDETSAATSAAQINALSPFGGRCFSATEGYYEYITKEPPLIAVEKQRGKTPHPELAVMQAEASFIPFMQQALENLRAEDMGEGPLLIIPVLGKAVQTPMFVRPDAELFYFIGFLRNAFPATKERVDELTQQNLVLYKQSCALGGNRYPCDSIPLPADPSGWAAHYGSATWAKAQACKTKYDPQQVFLSNLNIFGKPA